jgi:hypothetical protein
MALQSSSKKRTISTAKVVKVLKCLGSEISIEKAEINFNFT